MHCLEYQRGAFRLNYLLMETKKAIFKIEGGGAWN